MGCKWCTTRKARNLINLNLDSKIQDDIDFTFIPIDEFLCPVCGCISIILSNSINNGIIKYYCKNDGEKSLKIEDFIKSTITSDYQCFNQKCEKCSNGYKKYKKLNSNEKKDEKKSNKDNKENKEINDYNDSNIFKYCYICKKVLCQGCYEKDFNDHKTKCIKINELKEKCYMHFGESYKSFCLDCQEHICESESSLHEGHEKQSLSFFTDEEIKKSINIILKKNQEILNIIKFNNIILGNYTKYMNSNSYNSINNMKNTISKMYEDKKDKENKLKYIDLLIYKYEKDYDIQKNALKNVEEKLSLTLNGNEEILDLKNKKINDEKLNDISRIKFNSLKVINLSNNGIKNINIEIFKKMKCPLLEILDLSSNEIENIKPIKDLPFKNLKQLYLQRNKIKDITPLKLPNEYLKNLELLRLDDNEFPTSQNNINILNNYKNIIYKKYNIEEFNKFYNKEEKSINLSNLKAQRANLIKDLYLMIINHPDEEIEELNLNNNNLEDLSKLHLIPFPILKKLNLADNKIKDLNFLIKMDLSNLTHISLNNNEIKDISPLIKAEKLEIVDLLNNPILEDNQNKLTLYYLNTKNIKVIK